MSESPEPPSEAQHAHLDHRALAEELRDLRATLVELLRTLPESRAYRATARPGWTLKHELAALGAADAELVHLLDELRRRSGTLNLQLRRRRAEAMHGLQNLRLTPLIERLEQDGARAIEVLSEHGHELARAVHIDARHEGEAAPTPAAALVQAYRERAHRALETLKDALAH